MEAQLLHAGNVWFVWIVVVVIMAGVTVQTDFTKPGALGAWVFAVVVMAVIMWVFTKRQRRKPGLLLTRYYRSLYDSYPNLAEEVQVFFDQEEIRFSSCSGYSKLRFSEIANYKEGESVLLLYESPQSFRIVPNHVFEEGERRQLLASLNRGRA